MINKELLAKFDRIQDLPVSEEMLGAYMEGNLDGVDSSEIADAIASDEALSDLLENVDMHTEIQDTSDLDVLMFHSGINVDLPDITVDAFHAESLTMLDEIVETYGLDANDDFDTSDGIHTDFFHSENSYNADSFIDDSRSLNADSFNDDELFNDDFIDS